MSLNEIVSYMTPIPLNIIKFNRKTVTHFTTTAEMIHSMWGEASRKLHMMVTTTSFYSDEENISANELTTIQKIN